MQKLGDILKNPTAKKDGCSPDKCSADFNNDLFSDPAVPTPPHFSAAPNKYISNPDQLRALRLMQKFNDPTHKIFYLSACKNLSDTLLDLAEQFVSDANADNKGALFMWKIKSLTREYKETGKNYQKSRPLVSKKRSRRTKQKSLFEN